MQQQGQNRGATPGKEVLALIPARGGSKGVPGKNRRLLGDKPLVAYSIEAALAAANISRVLVSTDDERIQAVSREFGAEVPFLRPHALASDTACIEDVGRHAMEELQRMEGYLPDIVVFLYPTSPFRSIPTVEFLVDKLCQGYGKVATCQLVQPLPFSFLYEREDGSMAKLLDRRTDPAANTYFKPSGYLHGVFLDPAAQVFPEYFHMLEGFCEILDIDTEYDFLLAEEIIKENLYPLAQCN